MMSMQISDCLFFLDRLPGVFQVVVVLSTKYFVFKKNSPIESSFSPDCTISDESLIVCKTFKAEPNVSNGENKQGL